MRIAAATNPLPLTGFDDVNAGDATFAQGANEDLIITLGNGETSAFADSITLDAQGIRDRSVANLKTTLI